MSNIDLFSMAIRNLFKRKLRTFLTVLGVVVGTASIVIMISLGIAVNVSYEEIAKQMGDTTILNLFNHYDPYFKNENAKILGDEELAAISALEGVVVASPLIDTTLIAVSGKYSTWLNITGVLPDAMEPLGMKIAQGRELSGLAKYEIIFGTETPYQFMSERDRSGGGRMGGKMGMAMAIREGGGMGDEAEERAPPKIDVLTDKIMGSFVQGFEKKGRGSQGEGEQTTAAPPAPKPYKLNVTGVLEAGTGWNVDTRYANYMSITDVKEIQKAQQEYNEALNQGNGSSKQKKVDTGYNRVLVKCNNVKDVERVTKEIKAMGFEGVDSPISYVNSMKETSSSLQMLLGAIGAVALFVAAIGIANTMVMSIYERTREIGVMKVIGASIGDIKRLFLTEAALIGVLGGLFGLILSYILSYILNEVGIPFLQQMQANSKSDISVIPLWLYGMALGFSAVIGIVSGYFPARRATKISALSAIRTE